MYTLIIDNGELQCHIKSFTEGLELKELPDYSGKKETTAALYITTYISADNGENINTFDNISLVDFLPYFRVDNSIKNITIKDEEKREEDELSELNKERDSILDGVLPEGIERELENIQTQMISLFLTVKLGKL